MDTNAIIAKLLTLPGIIIGISFHEFAHAWVSDKLGDPTPRRQGRVTINPLAHIDWVGFIALLLIGFGWGKPVEINPNYYKNRRSGEFMVGIAGVTMNFIIAAVLSLILRLTSRTVAAGASDIVYNIYLMGYYAVMINVVLMVFNLLPCPPLDGWGLLTQLFRLDRYEWWYKVYQYGTWILLALIVFNITDLVLTPIVSFVMTLLL